MCHAFDQEAKDGHDLVIGLSTGDGKYSPKLKFPFFNEYLGFMNLFLLCVQL